MGEKYRGGEKLYKFVQTGIETKRSDTSDTTTKVMKDVLLMILMDKSEEEVRNYLQDFYKQFKSSGLETIGIPKGINQNISTYKIKSAHIRACEYSNRYFGTNFGKGSKPKMVYIIYKHQKKYPKTNVIAFEDVSDIPKDFCYVIDYNTMIEKLISVKLSRIFDILLWNFNDVNIGTQTKLSNFFAEDINEKDLVTDTEELQKCTN